MCFGRCWGAPRMNFSSSLNLVSGRGKARAKGLSQEIQVIEVEEQSLDCLLIQRTVRILNPHGRNNLTVRTMFLEELGA